MAYSWLSRLHHARSPGGCCNSLVLPTPRSQSPCTVQGLAEHFRLASSRSDERRGRGSNMAYDERRLQTWSLDYNSGGSETDMDYWISTSPSPRVSTKWLPVLHGTIRSSSDHLS